MYKSETEIEIQEHIGMVLHNETGQITIKKQEVFHVINTMIEYYRAVLNTNEKVLITELKDKKNI